MASPNSQRYLGLWSVTFDGWALTNKGSLYLKVAKRHYCPRTEQIKIGVNQEERVAGFWHDLEHWQVEEVSADLDGLALKVVLMIPSSWNPRSETFRKRTARVREMQTKNLYIYMFTDICTCASRSCP